VYNNFTYGETNITEIKIYYHNVV